MTEQRELDFPVPGSSKPVDLFRMWKATPGANYVLRDLVAIAARRVQRARRYGTHTSVKLLFELWRDDYRCGITRSQLDHRRDPAGHPLPAKADGYLLNNVFTAPFERWLMVERPDWRGMFRERRSPKPTKTRVYVVRPDERRAG